MIEKYFVASHSDEPDKIFFNADDAFNNDYNYIDTFDENGDKIKSYKYVDGEYITNF